MGAITPQEVVARKRQQIPEFVFDAFNDLIAKNWDGNSAVVSQRTAVAKIQEKAMETGATTAPLNKQQIYNEHWLDIVEDVYREAGWNVFYDKPSYCDDYYEPFFKFSMEMVMR